MRYFGAPYGQYWPLFNHLCCHSRLIEVLRNAAVDKDALISESLGRFTESDFGLDPATLYCAFHGGRFADGRAADDRRNGAGDGELLSGLIGGNV